MVNHEPISGKEREREKKRDRNLADFKSVGIFEWVPYKND